MRHLKYLTVSLGLTLVLLLTACGGTEVELPDLSSMGEIVAVSREEGSGTRSEFESLVDTDEAGTDTTVFSTEQVIEAVAGDENAIGYVAASALDTASGIKILAIDNVLPETANIADGSYSLCRQYLLAYTGSLSELESEFITYIQGAGQAIVALSATPVDDVTTFLSLKPSGTITISGSSSVAPLIEELAADYLTYNPNATITIEVSDSSEGINAALRGDCDLAMSSRSLKDYEEELLSSEVIAADGMAVIVNSANPADGLSMEHLKSIYDGDASAWTDLN